MPNPVVQIPQQSDGAGSPIDQAAAWSDARLQEVSESRNDDRRHRSHAPDQKRSIQTRQASRQKQNRFRDLECSARRVTSADFEASDRSAYNVCTTTIARTFWGKAWCENLERYSDFENRLPRGRTYVRNGSVVDLRIERGQVRAMVSGSELYTARIDIDTIPKARWEAICRDCLGSVTSLVELLQGKISKNVMERVCREGDGLFPSPREIRMRCSCPDWADMCKHASAVFYGVGARLDAEPDFLFALRGVDRSELIAGAGRNLPITTTRVAAERIVAEDDVAALFGLELEPAPSQSGSKDPDTGLKSGISDRTKRATTVNRSAAKGPISLNSNSAR